MEYRRFGNTYIVRLNRGEEVISCITKLCREENITLGSINGLGAADHAVIGLYDVEKQHFEQKELNCPLEISSIHGNISTQEGEIYLHVHINLADESLTVHGGHLKECRISATCELFIEKIEGTVERVKDPETGLNIYKFL